MKTLSEVVRDLNSRWPLPERIELDTESWGSVRSELENIMKRDGRLVLSADIGEMNFILRGIPVVAR